MHKIKTLSNGLKLITVPVAGTKTATVLVMVGTGAKYETKQNNGISHFLEHMFFKGTDKRPNTKIISSELDVAGGVYNAYTGKEETAYYAKVDASKTELALDIISDMYLHSKYEPVEIEREKGTIIEEINMYEDSPMRQVEDIFEHCLYGDQPAGWEVLGTKENILKMKREDFMDYIRSQYVGNNTVICIVGKINKNADKLVKKYFNSLKDGQIKPKQPVREKQSSPGMEIKNKKTDQAHISVGFRGYASGHKDEFVLKVISILLGGSMSSRMWMNVRERNGLAYYIWTATEFYSDSGYITTQAGVPIDKVEDAIKIIIEEYGKIKDEKLEKGELERVKEMVKNKTTIQFESSESNANWYAHQMIIGKKVISTEDYLKKINKVSAKDIARVAKDVFVNKGLNLAIIGPYKNKGKFEKLLKF